MVAATCHKVCGGCDVGVFRGPSGTRQWRLWVFLTTRGPQPGIFFFFCLHGPALPSFLPPSAAIPCCTTPARLTVWGYVGKFCVSCISLGGLVNNHTIHGMFRHKAPCRALLGSAAARNIFFNFLARKNPAAAPLVSRFALLWRRSCISTAGTRPARPLPPTS